MNADLRTNIAFALSVLITLGTSASAILHLYANTSSEHAGAIHLALAVLGAAMAGLYGVQAYINKLKSAPDAGSTSAKVRTRNN